MTDMTSREDTHIYVLLSIALSHYNEKARRAFAYYQVPCAHHLLMPWLHIFTTKPIVNSGVCTHEPRDNVSSPFSTPCLAVYDTSGTKLQESFHDSHDILVHLSEKFSSPNIVNLYTSCGAEKANEIYELERHYDEDFGGAVRDFIYLEMTVFNKWHAMLPFALLVFRNRVGPLKSLVWFGLSPLIGRMITSVMGMSPSKHEEALQTCREIFRHASECELHLYLIS